MSARECLRFLETRVVDYALRLKALYAGEGESDARREFDGGCVV